MLSVMMLMAAAVSRPRAAGPAQAKAPAGQATRPGAQSKSAQQFISIDFNNVDISVFIKFISELTGTNFVVDPRVRGKVTIISPSKISLAEAYKVFESVLEVHGYTTVRAGDVVKIIPAPDARAKNIETKLQEKAAATEDRVVTQLIPLKYADPVEIKRLFTPLVSRSSVVLAYSPTNMLIVTDVYSNIKRLIRILKAIDLPGVGQEISVIPLDYADASKLVNLLGTIFKPARRRIKGLRPKSVTMVADDRTNTIILLASEVDTLRIKSLISMLDRETPRGKGKIHVYYCKNATAEDLAKVLQNLPNQQVGAPKAKKGAAVSGKVKITADKATNSLIILADKEDYLVLEGVIKKLDIPRAMVYLEALIMEVNMDKSLDLGVNWSAFGKASLGGKETAIGGGFSNGLLTPESVIPQGFQVGMISEPVTIAGLEVSNIAAIINAFSQDDEVHILSTPQLLTTDNEEAKIMVGENRPYQTTQTTTASNNTFNSFEYRDVGNILKITPHVTEGRLVRLKIGLDVTRVNQAQTGVETQPVTFKRSIDTTVIIKDNHTVVIGGLIDHGLTDNVGKVPGAGDIPLLGWLFKTKTKRNNRTNLYIFITPRVIKNPLEADNIYLKKKKHINTIEEGGIKLYNRDKTEKNVRPPASPPADEISPGDASPR